MPHAHFRHDGTTFKEVTGAWIYDDTGTLRNVLNKWRMTGGDWKQYFGGGSGELTVQVTPGAVDGYCNAIAVISPGEEQIPCQPVANASAVVTGGTGPFTFLWERVPDGSLVGGSIDFLTPDQLTLQDVQFRGTVGISNSVKQQRWKVTITDTDDMSTTSDTVLVTLERQNNL
jgi:hypothetical protein